MATFSVLTGVSELDTSVDTFLFHQISTSLPYIEFCNFFLLLLKDSAKVCANVCVEGKIVNLLFYYVTSALLFLSFLPDFLSVFQIDWLIGLLTKVGHG